MKNDLGWYIQKFEVVEITGYFLACSLSVNGTKRVILSEERGNP